MKIQLLAILALILTACSATSNLEYKLLPAEDFPKWLKEQDVRTDQTSGIAFINSENGKKQFLLADDIGELFYMDILNDKNLELKKISFSENVMNYLSTFPKKDFEEIVYDKFNGDVLLSIEGNGPDFKEYVGIYKVKFRNNDITSGEVVDLSKMDFTPTEEFLKYTDWNIGYEGLAVDKNYYYLGLEGFMQNNQFADSAIIRIADKNSLKIIKEINTRSFGISTICGLYSDKDHSIWGIDRNNRRIFHLTLNEDLNVIEHFLIPLKTTIPSYPEFIYNSSLESITFDDHNSIYLVDDPWKQVFIPSDDVLKKLDYQTVENFKSLVPVIHKFKLSH